MEPLDQTQMMNPTVPGMEQEEKSLSEKLNVFKQKRIQGEAQMSMKKIRKPIATKPANLLDTLFTGQSNGIL